MAAAAEGAGAPCTSHLEVLPARPPNHPSAGASTLYSLLGILLLAAGLLSIIMPYKVGW